MPSNRHSKGSINSNLKKVVMSSSESDQYVRHNILPEIGIAGQEKLLKSKVGILGAGGLGSPVIQYLTSFGVGHILIVDNDIVESVNLNRQVIHNSERIGMLKSESAQKSAHLLNPNIEILQKSVRVDETNGVEIFQGCDVLVDCCDNHQTRYLISSVGVKLGIPVVTGSVVRWEGHVTVLNYKGGPCYKCLYPTMPAASLNATAKTAGVVGTICGVIGSIEAMEVVKIILDKGEVLSGKMFMFNGLTLMHKIVTTKKRSLECTCCGSSK
ncbi:molybdopterin biosynthesis moeb protein, putative [Entamoeba invadens IP1]|uniref:Molybdopterin biosynthesis moeb protein, putative n=1 Tax=Entamoeba invadens IP1 TaxID=370355 RepID=A0A0A1U693_ENTIV|nr:molybdopterin biosynthesis moeb protein, putative [Entamoeba invadens IP1]ELP87351.1 molybdopterin biosynthesis moeb protein, putative [Entamoeba invadens IP1]|eukprot:XP_004254122.1 molybdopterin biosynthesis moeb protein, putative [Entamoeba invadens IP1]